MNQLLKNMDRPKFLPPRLGSLKLWLDSSDASTITKDGSNLISQWNDKSVNANNAVQATGAAQPTWVSSQINSRDVVDFNSTGKGMSIASASSIDNIFASGGTAVFVINIDSAGVANLGRIFEKTQINLLFQSPSGSTCKLSMNQLTSGTLGTWITTNTVVTFNTTSIVTVTYNAASVATAPVIRVNGVAAAITVSSTPTGTAVSDATYALIVGNRGALDRGCDGRISEFIMLNRTLSPEEIVNLETHLANKWGVTI